MKCLKPILQQSPGRAFLLASFLAASQFAANAQTLFSDSFQTDSSANWDIYGISANGATNDYTAQFAFDYSTQAYRFNGVTNFVPPSPNSGGTTKGLKVTVNKNGAASLGAVSLYPKNQSFSNNFALKFDLWTDYSGDIPFGDGGSTEFAAFGINHYGTNVNWPGATPNGDGYWYLASAEGGSSRDFRAYSGDLSPGANAELDAVSGGFLDRDGDSAPDQNVPDSSIFSPFQLMFPAPPGQTVGGIGKQWVQVEIRQQNGNITWLVNGYIIATHPNVLNGSSAFTSGNIMIGQQDPFNAELPDEPYENYSIFDNVRVVDLSTNDPLPVIDASATDNDASEPGSNTGTVTLTRTGSTTAPLTVNLRLTGTASNGVDYVTIPSTVTPINDSIGEAVETVIVNVVGNTTNYDVGNNYAIVNITDDNDVPVATIKSLRPGAYENNHAGLFNVILSNPNAIDTTVHFSATGTAVNGVAYTNIGSTVLIPAGTTNALVAISPLNNTNREGDRTISITLTPSSGYVIGAASNATEVLFDDDFAQGGTLFGDDFETDSSSLWTINRSASDGAAFFAFDYSTIGVPSAPHSVGNTTLGLKLQANCTNATISGVSLSPTGKSFTGDYRLRFDLWINYLGPLFDGGAGSTTYASAGLGTKGVNPVYGLNTSIGPATSDGVWVSVDGDSGNGRDVKMWRTSTEVVATAATNSGIYATTNQNTANNPYYWSWGLESASPVQLALFPSQQTGISQLGNAGFAWHDVVLTKIGTNITWVMDGLKIASLNATGVPMSTNVFVGFYDPTSGKQAVPDVAFALVDNLRVVTMQAPQITSIQTIGANVQIDFTASTADSPSGFTLQSTSIITVAPADVTSTITQLSPGVFRAVRASSGGAQFYRVRR